MIENTIEYYNKNAEKFLVSTKDVVFTAVQDRFLAKLFPGASVLDFGCGSGRDTKYFLSKGMNVSATDGSEQMVKAASELTGIDVQRALFTDLSDVERYDGIWACSSILHCPMEELKEVFRRMVAALKSHGIIYTSFKYGPFEGERNGRFFMDMDEEKFASFIADFPELSVEEQWINADVRPGREDEKWLNLILRKNV